MPELINVNPAKSTPIREEFLKEFIERIITQGHSNIIAKEKLRMNLQALENWKAQEAKKAEEEKYYQSVQLPIKTIQPQKTQRQPAPKAPPKQMFMPNPTPRQTPLRMSMSAQSTKDKDEYKPSITAQQPTTPGLSKILPILSQSDVSSLECTSPGKPILINKYGNIQVSNLSLSEAEINQILQEVSQKTRIPIITGVFKAMFDNYLFTAIVSEFVGTRFIIQKKPMMQSPMSNQRLQPIIR
jgi:hypothetical protein